MTLQDISNGGLIAAFMLYTLSTIAYVITLTGRKWSNREPAEHKARWGRIGFVLAIAGFIAHLTFFVTRWIYAHIPVSNMFEFLTLLAMMIMAAFIVIYFIYRSTVLGVFALPLAVVILGYAAVFPWEAQPLIPALQSIWLYIHVTLAALGEAFFAVGFAAGLMYLLRTIDYTAKTKQAVRQQRGVEFTLFVVFIIIGFIISVFGFRATGYHAEFETIEMVKSVDGDYEMMRKVEYVHPVIVAPNNGDLVKMDSFLGMDKPLMKAPSWMKGLDSGRKLNTVIWSLISGLLLYGIVRLIVRKPLGAAIQPALEDLEPEDIDEISYRAIAIGFPIFTLGALIFAMIWAQIAWTRFWAWDPKEVWALITWLFYSAYLHLRLSRGWLGKKSAWLSVIGFLIVMFTLVGVNLIIAGLHSYAGV